MSGRSQEFIRVGVADPYLHAILIVVTGSGALLVTGALPGYDPAVLALPFPLVYTLYLMFLVGGLTVYVGFATGLLNRIWSLRVQAIGLLIQGLPALVLAIAVTVVLPARAAFIAMFGSVIAVMHLIRVTQIVKELRLAPAKVDLARWAAEELQR